MGYNIDSVVFFIDVKNSQVCCQNHQLENGYFFAILSATPTSAASKIHPVCHGCGTTGLGSTASV